MERMDTCSGCRFWARVDGPSGSCRRRAPIVTAIRRPNGSDDVHALWPGTVADEWCGEFELRRSQT